MKYIAKSVVWALTVHPWQTALYTGVLIVFASLAAAFVRACAWGVL